MSRNFATVCLGFLVLLGAVACEQDLTQSPAFQEQRKRVQSVDDELADLVAQVSRLEAQLQQVSRDMAELRQDGGGGDLQPLVTRIEALERRIDELRVGNQQMQQQLDQLAERPAAAASSPAPESASAAEAPKAKKPSRAKRSAAEPDSPPRLSAEPAVSPPVTPKPPPKRQATDPGRWHQIQAGETLASIAEAYGVSEAGLREANRLPDGARARAGQRIFVPAR